MPSLREPDHVAVMSWLGALEKKAAAMAFPAYGSGYVGGAGAGTFWGDGTGTAWGPLLPGSQYDYVQEAGDLWMNSAVAACTGWIADNFSEPALQVCERAGAADGRTTEERPVLDDPFLAAMDEPNPDYDADALWAATILSFLVSGNAFWIKAKSPGRSKMWLYYAPHWEIEPRWTADGRSFITRYDHVVDGKRHELLKSDVVHFRHGLDPRNVRSGLPQLMPVLREVCADNSGATYTAAVLRNMGVPGVLITPESDTATIDDDEASNIKQLWSERVSGDRAGKPLVSSLRMKIQELTLTPEKMALDRIRRIPEARICAALKIPPTVVGLSVGEDQRSYANSASDERKAYRNCLIPLQKSFARTLTRQLLPDFAPRGAAIASGRRRVRWDYSNVEAMADDQDALAKRTSLLFTSGGISREEYRAKNGYGPARPSDTFMAPKGVLLGSVDELAELTQAPPAPKGPDPGVGSEGTPGGGSPDDGFDLGTGWRDAADRAEEGADTGAGSEAEGKSSSLPATVDGLDRDGVSSGPVSDAMVLRAMRLVDALGRRLDVLSSCDPIAAEREDDTGPFSSLPGASRPTGAIDSAAVAAKNCGTGHGGFKPGNVCGGGGGGGSAAKPGRRGKAKAKGKRKHGSVAKPAASRIARTREGTAAQRAGLARQVRAARAEVAGDRDGHSALAKRVRAMRAQRRAGAVSGSPGGAAEGSLTKRRRTYADEQEKAVAGALGGSRLKDYESYDVIVPKRGIRGDHSIEVKSTIYGSKAELSVHANAWVRKIDDAAANPGRTYHTVLLDKRDVSEGGRHADRYSGHTIYYRRASGPYAISGMYKVKDMAELDRLIHLPASKLPAAARGTFPAGDKLAALRVKAERERAYNNARSKERKKRLGAAAYGK